MSNQKMTKVANKTDPNKAVNFKQLSSLEYKVRASNYKYIKH